MKILPLLLFSGKISNNSIIPQKQLCKSRHLLHETFQPLNGISCNILSFDPPHPTQAASPFFSQILFPWCFSFLFTFRVFSFLSFLYFSLTLFFKKYSPEDMFALDLYREKKVEEKREKEQGQEREIQRGEREALLSFLQKLALPNRGSNLKPRNMPDLESKSQHFSVWGHILTNCATLPGFQGSIPLKACHRQYFQAPYFPCTKIRVLKCF